MNSRTVQISVNAKTQQSFTTRLLIGGLLINLFVVTLAVISLSQSRDQYQRQAETTTQNLSRILDEYLAGAIDKINVALFAVSNEYERQLAGGGVNGQTLNEYIKREHSVLPYLDSLRIANAQGIIAYGIGVAPGSRASVTDRDYFIYLRDTPNAGLAISKPVIGKISGKWVIIFGRRLNNQDGSFAGVVYAVIALEHLSKIFSSLDVGPHGTIGMRDGEMGLVARYPVDANNPAAGIGQKVVSKEVLQRIQAGQTEGTYKALTGIDKVERVFSYRKLSNYPFYVFVGQASEDYLAEWHKQAIQTSAMVVFFFLVTLLSASLLYRSWKRQLIAAEEVREKKEFLDTILENEPECVKVIAPNGNLLQMNQAGLAMLEVDSILEAKKEGLVNFILPECRDAFMELGQRVFRGEPGVLEFQIEGKKGTRRWLDTHASPLRNANGDVVALVGVTRDITERKRVEAELHRLNETLDQRVKEEVAKNLAQEKLLIQQSRHAAMGEMIGNIAHQWRQPINTLALLLANLKDANDFHELDTAMINKTTAEGQQLIQNMSTTIDDFRNFFMPNKEKQSFLACESVEEAIKLVSHSFENHNIEVELIKSGEPCEVLGYPNEFAQVVLNALSNAKEAIVEKKASGKLHIQVEKGTTTATVSIRDDGGGIPADILPRVFDPYFTTKEKGTGIGLYMSKMIMDNMGGDITIRNVEDGAEVLLILPLASSLVD